MDYYTTLRRETVKSARFDPLIFLYAHLGDEGAFDGRGYWCSSTPISQEAARSHT